MVPIVESFTPMQENIVSVIGNEYGDIYEAQLDRAKASTLNKKEPAFVKDYIQPAMKLLKPKL
jgi:hypothetical protein